ncbi:MAG: MptD family putative ECF transporter S component [Lachnospiraceae bacterium]
MKTKSLNLKDYIFLGLLSIVGLVIYLVSIGLAAVAILPLGTVGYLLSNGIFGLLGGIVFVFICSKISAKGRMTVFFAILLLVISSLGGAYLPFVISTMAAAVLSDLLLLRLGSERAIAQYISWPLMQVGILFGTMVPVWLFTQSFADVFIEKGSSAAYVADQIYYSQGGWAVASIAFTVLLSLTGVWIARKILIKYIQPQEEELA